MQMRAALINLQAMSRVSQNVLYVFFFFIYDALQRRLSNMRSDFILMKMLRGQFLTRLYELIYYT